MPINHEACLPFKDVWAAKGSELYAALEAKDFEKAKRLYEEGEEKRLKLERGEK